MVDVRLARSFRGIGAEYHRYRPGFPAAAAQAIVPKPVDAVLDLGAGTGKFTVELVPRADRVFAVDPSAAMLAVLQQTLSRVDARLGSAERIPLDDASVDVVTAAQSFHWFERDPACVEIRRVLRPGGVLGLLWNHTDPDCTWDVACHRIAHPGSAVSARSAEEDAEDLPGFAFESATSLRWSESVARDDYVRRWLTVSTFLAAEASERARMTSQVERVLDTDAATRHRATLRLPQITDVFIYRRTD